MTTKEQIEQLPDMSAAIASMGRGSMQRRIEELERLLIEVEYTSSFMDESANGRIQRLRQQIQRAREGGIITRQPK